MKAYDVIFLNHYNYYGRTFASKPDQGQSISFVALLQSLHILILATPFNYFGQFDKGYDHSVAIISIIIMSITIFNLFYYNSNKVNGLITEYNRLSDNEKQRNRLFSIVIFIGTWLSFFAVILYTIYKYRHGSPALVLASKMRMC